MTSVICATVEPKRFGNPDLRQTRAASFDSELISLLPNLRAFARSLSSNWAQADDLVQETCASAIDYAGSFTPGTNMIAWLFTILRNKFYAQVRSRKREVEDVEGVYAASLTAAPNQDPSADLRDTMDALGCMKSKQRQLLLVVGRDGVTYEEAARRTRCAVGTVKSRTHRARHVLNRLLTKTTSVRSAAGEFPEPFRAKARCASRKITDMKKYLFSGIAAVALLATSGFAFAQRDQSQYGQHNDAPSGWEQQRDTNARDDQNYRDNRQIWRDRRESVRWNEGQHNGYYIGNRWAYGPPTMLQVRRGAVPGYQPWAVGRYLGYYNHRFDEIDFRRENLRQPPRGYHWVRDDRGDFLLASVRNGRIIAVAVSGHQPRDRRQSWRDDRADSHWDNGRHNGYYRNDRWTYGPPPNNISRDDIVLGYHPWSRGESLGYYQGRYAEVDYRSRRDLRPPPRGYHWVQSDSGDLLLAAVATGLIAQVILNDNR